MTRPGSTTPAVRYADSGGVHIAYQVFGDGPVDLVLVPGFVSHIEYSWQEPLLARFLRLLSGFARVIAFDKRGMGLSDRDPDGATPDLSQRVRDVVAVLDAVGSPRAALLAWSEGGPTAISFAHTCPERASSLVLLETTARFLEAPGYPEGVPPEVLDVFIDTMRSDWGTGVGFDLYAPSLSDDTRARAWWASYQRYAATPGAVAASLRLQVDIDVRDLLPRLRLPVLVFHRPGDMVVPVECGQYLARHIPGATLVEPPGEDHMYWVGHQDDTIERIRSFLAATPDGAALATMRRTQTRARVGWESLTRAELDIAALVAEGMSNAQIAARLTISPRTVQSHLRHIQAKLDARNRSEIAAHAVQRAAVE